MFVIYCDKEWFCTSISSEVFFNALKQNVPEFVIELFRHGERVEVEISRVELKKD